MDHRIGAFLDIIHYQYYFNTRVRVGINTTRIESYVMALVLPDYHRSRPSIGAAYSFVAHRTKNHYYCLTREPNDYNAS
jgi:hypothetical protein